MKIENDKDFNNMNINNIMNPNLKNQRYVEQSIESIIKTNMNLSPKNRAKNLNKRISERNSNISTIDKKYYSITNPCYNVITYDPPTPRYINASSNINKKIAVNNKKNNIAQYFNDIDDYNKLLDDYNKTKMK